jgi:hypothetical protein
MQVRNFLASTCKRFPTVSIPFEATCTSRAGAGKCASLSGTMSQPGADVMIFKNIFVEKFVEHIGIFLAQTTASF